MGIKNEYELLTKIPMINLSAIITTLILIAYFIYLYRITGRNRSSDKLIRAFAIVALLGVAYHIWLFSIIIDDKSIQNINPMSILLFSVQYSLEMFLANTIIIKNEVQTILGDNPLMFHVFLTLYGMAVLTSGFSIFHFLSRRLYNWFWLTFHKSSIKTHIFIGINDASLCLADDIMKTNKDGTIKDEEQIVFIDLPDHQEGQLQGISIWDIIARFFKDSKETEKLSNYVVLKAGKGIEKIAKWLKEAQNRVYILSDSQLQNLSILENLWEHKEQYGFKCKIYCHAKKEGLINRYDSITDVEDRVTFIDSSYLSVVSLKKIDSGKMLPVRFVDIAEDPVTKNKLGYVTSVFNCAIIGFGETGKESLKFLYEFGAFANKDNGKAPFKCHIFDNNLDKELGELGIDLATLQSPAAKEPEFELHSCAVGTIEFRAEMSKLINELNYIVICLGDDNLNVKTALNIVECAAIEGRDTKDKFRIAIKQAKTGKLNKDTLANANKAYNNCIHPFGLTEDIWKMDVISNEELDSDARRFYESYSIMSAELNKRLQYPPNPSWEGREENGIRSKDYEKRCEARRQKAQDYSNSLHKTTKQALCEPYNKDEQARCEYYNNLSSKIYDVNRNKNGEIDITGISHCEEDTNTETMKILEHLAVCEHLRWETSLMLMGYRPTDGKNKDLKKLHNCIKPYSKLPEFTKHYDWLVVKNSLSDLKIQNANPQETIKDKYIPNPISTNDVTLSSEILELSEKIAENVHEVWAQSRIAEGWTYGPQRDDTKKEHPCLVPYNELPEIEKEYDRNTSQETLKLIIKLGFKIEK